MRANKVNRFLRRLTAVILSIGLIAVPCLECSSGSLISLAASNDGLASEEGAESGSQYRTPTELRHDTKQPATPTELEEPKLNRDDTLTNSIALDALVNTSTNSTTELKNRALIIVSNSEDIVESTHADAEALAATLRQTNEFKDCADDDITIMYFDISNEQDDTNKKKV